MNELEEKVMKVIREKGIIRIIPQDIDSIVKRVFDQVTREHEKQVVSAIGSLIEKKELHIIHIVKNEYIDPEKNYEEALSAVGSENHLVVPSEHVSIVRDELGKHTDITRELHKPYTLRRIRKRIEMVKRFPTG
ncbi:MAG: hypothetical protein J7K68_06175 [Candidatus Diapherotrites archaeon]|nr:hypothetical protein [Candidatus Diapherotrites archaeon]